MFQTLDQQFLELPPLRFACPIGPLLVRPEWRQGPSTSRAGFEWRWPFDAHDLWLRRLLLWRWAGDRHSGTYVHIFPSKIVAKLQSWEKSSSFSISRNCFISSSLEEVRLDVILVSSTLYAFSNFNALLIYKIGLTTPTVQCIDK